MTRPTLQEPDFGTRDVSDWPVIQLEPGGSDEKVWLIAPSGERALFKPNRGNLSDDQGEDWAEKLVSEIATLLGIPAAAIDLATRCGVRGCVSYNVAPNGYDLQPGALLLDQLLSGDFDPREVGGHSLENIQRVLCIFGPPPGFTGPSAMGAFDVFGGYLLLDALVANRDRHSENWAVLLGSDSPDALAPSYDHASALGFNLHDQRRTDMLRDPRMLSAFLNKGTAYRFDGCKKTSLVALCHRSFEAADSGTREFWLGQLERVSEQDFAALAAKVPRMSEVARNLCIELLTQNRRRLLDG